MAKKADEKINTDDKNKDANKDDKKGEPTVAELAEKLKVQDELLIDMSKENSRIVAINEASQKEVGELKEQIGGLNQLLTNIANRDEDDGSGNFGEDDDKRLQKIADERALKTYQELEKNKTEKQKAEDRVFIDEYRETTKDLLDEEENPKGEPLDAKARKEIVEMMKTKEFNHLDGVNAAKEARRNFKKVYKRYYGLDKKNPFKGGNPAGTGISGEFNPESPTKPTYTFNEAALKQLQRAGITKEKAEELMKKREEREALV